MLALFQVVLVVSCLYPLSMLYQHGKVMQIMANNHPIVIALTFFYLSFASVSLIRRIASRILSSLVA